MYYVVRDDYINNNGWLLFICLLVKSISAKLCVNVCVTFTTKVFLKFKMPKRLSLHLIFVRLLRYYYTTSTWYYVIYICRMALYFKECVIIMCVKDMLLIGFVQIIIVESHIQQPNFANISRRETILKFIKYETVL